MKRHVLIPLILLSLGMVSACCSPQVGQGTLPGRPEITVNGTVDKSVQGAIMNVMINNAYTLKDSSESQMVFEKIN